MGLLDNKIAVITGAGSGMGKASTRVFVREGASVLAADISGAEEATAAEVGEGVIPFRCDVAKEADVQAMIDAAVYEFGRVDAVLNVAGIGIWELMDDVTMEHFDTILDVDLRGVLLGTQYGARAMTKSGGGAIINWSSTAGLNCGVATSVYSAAKAGVIAITKAAAVEYGDKGVRANALCPGVIVTEIMGAHTGNKPEAAAKAALGRTGQAEEVAEVAAFLASERASFVSGAIIPVDGGWSVKLA